MSLLTKIKERFRRSSVTLELDDIQALLLRSRPEPYVGIHVMLHIQDAAGGRDLLGRLAPHITSAHDWTEDLDYWIGVGISYQGLKALGVPEEALKTFPLPFQQGMAARAQQLRDRGPNAPENWEEAFQPGNCHLALTIYAQDKEGLDRALASAKTELEHSHGVTLIGSHEFGAPEGVKNPFGFRDNISNPAIEGSGIEPLPGEERAIKAGEFILGYPSENGQNLGLPQPDVLGRNGSYVVFRKYISRVGTFNAFLQEHAGTPEEQELLAAKLFGRWRSGAPLLLAPDRDDPELGSDPQRNNHFNYHDDPKGMVAPLGCHMRRLNPRDAELTLLTDVNIHRIIRRSSTFGPVYSSDVTPDEDAKGERGIFFIFISARAFDTIEFLQQEWINRGNFIDLGEERDPIAGLHEENSLFTLPGKPVRKRISGVETFNVMKGGEYLFLPSLSALRWLAGQTPDEVQHPNEAV
jgi:Dyp-type peroxidase family